MHRPRVQSPNSAGRLPATGHMTWKKKPRRLLGSVFGQTSFCYCLCTLWATWLTGCSILIESRWLETLGLLQNVSILCRKRFCQEKNNPCIDHVYVNTNLKRFVALHHFEDTNDTNNWMCTNLIKDISLPLWQPVFSSHFSLGFSMGWLSTWREV